MGRRGWAAFICVGIVGAAAHVLGQTPTRASLLRVFLKDGHALPSYGQPTQVADRLVFVLPVGDLASHVELQLMSLPVATVDLARTARYADAVLARDYAETRGPAEYSQIAADVNLTLAALEKETDHKRGLALAEEARSKLVAWPADHYGYRAAEIQTLVRQVRSDHRQPGWAASLGFARRRGVSDSARTGTAGSQRAGVD